MSHRPGVHSLDLDSQGASSTGSEGVPFTLGLLGFHENIIRTGEIPREGLC